MGNRQKDDDAVSSTDQMLNLEAERFERRLREEISAVREEISGVRVELHDGLAAVRHGIDNARVEVLKWSFLFWIGQVAAIAGLLAFMLRGVPR